MRVRLKQSMASSGAQTIGSFSLTLVFRMTGTPFLRSKPYQSAIERILFRAPKRRILHGLKKLPPRRYQ
jgi:hypothetical protein